MQRIALVFTALFLAACSSSKPAIVGCEPVGEITPYCNMQTPEDIAALPDGRHLLLAHFGHMGESSGSISLWDTQTESLTPLFPPAAGAPEAADETWGQADCTAPPNASFSPHGTHLHQLANGRWRYLVVNHGDREAVELFELRMDGDTPALAWRGCVVAHHGDTMMNDVVGLDNGDLIYSRMFGGSDALALIKSLFKIDTGELWRWHRATGLEPLPATSAAQPNGLEISADNRYVFANMYMEEQVWKVRLADGEVVERYAIANADNSSWGSDGRLWVASHTMGLLDIVGCFSQSSAACPGSFAIVALDTGTGETETVFEHAGPPMGAATVAVPQGGRVYLGSFVGDRMIAVPDFTQPGLGETR